MRLDMPTVICEEPCISCVTHLHRSRANYTAVARLRSIVETVDDHGRPDLQDARIFGQQSARVVARSIVIATRNFTQNRHPVQTPKSAACPDINAVCLRWPDEAHLLRRTSVANDLNAYTIGMINAQRTIDLVCSIFEVNLHRSPRKNPPLRDPVDGRFKRIFTVGMDRDRLDVTRKNRSRASKH
ncbi:hypothetical protein WL56_03510 [Burkholderia cepacia]|nr:hypothetical protein WL56_03510 [Burkholderia cepacia]